MCRHGVWKQRDRPLPGTTPSLSSPDDLRAARARLIADTNGELRRIERALHDGVQQDLIAMSIRLQLVRQLADADVPGTLAMLDEIGHDVRDALDRVRTLANGIYPSLLEARGLPDAIRGAASAARVPATIEAAGVGRYPADVEAAVYFCCRVALEAAAGAARVTIRIGEAGKALRLEISLDAGALAAGRLALARDRIEALGGLLSVDAAQSLAATVPLP
jgi:signal transduction histidine kinase